MQYISRFLAFVSLVLPSSQGALGQGGPTVSAALESQPPSSGGPNALTVLPSRQVGDSCTYAVKEGNKELPLRTWRVAKVDPDGFTFEVLDSQGQKTRDAFQTLEGNPRFPYDLKQHRPYFQYPLVVGKKWSGSYTYPDRNGGVTKTETTVVGWEEVDVPAIKGKKLQALKIVVNGKYTESGGSGPIVETVWFLPEVQCFAKYTHYCPVK